MQEPTTTTSYACCLTHPCSRHLGPGLGFNTLRGGGGLGRRGGGGAGGCCSCIKTLCECIRHRQYSVSARARGQLGESGELLSAAATSSFVTLRQTSKWQLHIMHEVMAR